MPESRDKEKRKETAHRPGSPCQGSLTLTEKMTDKNPQGALQISPELKEAGGGESQSIVSSDCNQIPAALPLSPCRTPRISQSCCSRPALTRVTTLSPTLSKMKLPSSRRIESPKSWHFLGLVPEHTYMGSIVGLLTHGLGS